MTGSVDNVTINDDGEGAVTGTMQPTHRRKQVILGCGSIHEIYDAFNGGRICVEQLSTQ